MGYINCLQIRPFHIIILTLKNNKTFKNKKNRRYKMKGKTKVKKAKAKKTTKKVVKDTKAKENTKKETKVNIKDVLAKYRKYMITGTEGGKRIKFVIPVAEISLPERKSLTAYLHGKVGIGKEGCATFKVNSEYRIFIQKDKIKEYEKAIGHKVSIIEKKVKKAKKEPEAKKVKKSKKVVKKVKKHHK